MNKDKYFFADPCWGNGVAAAPPGRGLAKHWNWLKAQSGNTHPGALLPFGWVSVLPYSGGYSSGYGSVGVSGCGEVPKVFDRPVAKGFTHFHTSGVGFLGEFYNYLLLTPVAAGWEKKQLSALDEAQALPGSFKGKLSDYGVEFALTASKFAAMHRIEFAAEGGTLTLDTMFLGLDSVAPPRRESMSESGSQVRGEKLFTGFVLAHGKKIYFAWHVSGTVLRQWCEGSLCCFEFAGRKVESVLAFSLISEAEACDRAYEAAAKGFDTVETECQEAWRKQLNRISAEFENEEQEKIFYSALYHALVKPVDAGCEFTDFETLWDIYRTQLPLVMTIAPEAGEKILRSMLATSARIGFFPCAYLMSTNYKNCDIQATALAVYIWCDGFFRNLLTKADYPELKSAFEREFAHADISGKSPTHTLDLAGAYSAASRVARACGDTEYADTLQKNSAIWRNVYDPETGLLIENAVYYEGDHWNYSFRPHVEMAARVALAGGGEKFENLLDKFFGFNCQDEYASVRPQIPHRFEGMNNESDMETPAAYLWCGRADKQAQIHAEIRKNMFLAGEGGCPGNNDSGALGSWYVWSCLGLMPYSGVPYIILGTPAVKSAEFAVAGGTLRIEVERTSPEAFFPAGYEFNGRKLQAPWLHLDEFAQGGVLKFFLTDSPVEASPLPDWFEIGK